MHLPRSALQDSSATLGRLSEVLHGSHPALVPASFVWGYGRGLWDPAVRDAGKHPLRVCLLGPAASGKSTLAARLAERWVHAVFTRRHSHSLDGHDAPCYPFRLLLLPLLSASHPH